MKRKLKTENQNLKGRNLDYGHVKSDSGEGKMVRRAMLTMAKDLYELYCSINDGDDLPQWCHYKIANSKKDLSDVCDYITSKITKNFIDNNISIDFLKKEINSSVTKNLIKEEIIKEFWKKKKKPEFNEFYTTIRGLKSNDLVSFLNDLKEMSNTIYKTVDIISSYKVTNYSDVISTFRKIRIIKESISLIDEKLNSIELGILNINKFSNSKISKKKNILDRFKSFFKESYTQSSNVKNNLTSLNIDGIYNSLNTFILKHQEFLNSSSKKSLLNLRKEYNQEYKNFSISQEDFYNKLIIYITDYIIQDYSKVKNFLEDTEKKISSYYNRSNVNTIPKPLDPDFKTNTERDIVYYD